VIAATAMTLGYRLVTDNDKPNIKVGQVSTEHWSSSDHSTILR
jgi:predicted nucleic acid-binding protein